MELTPQETPPTTIVPPSAFAVPSAKQQSWGTIVSIVIIVGMIVLGAFYSWGKRIAEEQALTAQTSTTTTP